MRIVYLYLLANIFTISANNSIGGTLVLEAVPFPTDTTQHAMPQSSCNLFRSQLPPLSMYDQFVQHTHHWNSSQFANYFDPLIHAGFVHENHILTLYKLYKYPGFRAYISTLPSFAQHIASLHAKMHCCKKHKKELGSITGLWQGQLKEYLCPLAHKAQRMQQEQKALQEREAQRIAQIHREQQEQVALQVREKQRIAELHREQLKQIQKHNVDTTAEQHDDTMAQWRMHASDGHEHSARYEKRLQAFEQSVHADTWSEQTYPLHGNTVHYLKQHQYNPEQYTALFGNSIQHQLHTEFIEIIDGIATIDPSWRTMQQIKGLRSIALESADIGMQYNRQGCVIEAGKIADFCFAALDCARAYLQGCATGACELISTALHPIDTAVGAIAGIGGVAYCLGVVLHDFVELDFHLENHDDAAAEVTRECITQRFTTVCGAIANSCQDITLRDGFSALGNFMTTGFLKKRLHATIGKFYTKAFKQFSLIPEQLFKGGGISLAACSAVQPDIANKALKRAPEVYKATITKNLAAMLSNFKQRIFRCDITDFVLTKERLHHILQRHHPKCWHGISKKDQSFFHRTISVDEIYTIIEDVITQNRDKIIKYGKQVIKLETDPRLQVDGWVKGIKYTLGFKKNRIGQLFPPLDQS